MEAGGPTGLGGRVTGAVFEAASRELPRPSVRDQARYVRRMFVDPRAVLDDIASRYGPVCGLGFGPVRSAVVGDPAALRDLFAVPAESLRWGHKFNVLGFVVGGGSMIVSDGEDHRRRRSSVQAAFSIRRLNGWMPMIVARTDRAVDGIRVKRDGEVREVDMYTVGRSVVLGIVIHALFGERLSRRAGEIGDLFQSAQDYLELPPYRQAPHPLPFGARARVRADRRALDAIIDSEIATRRARPSRDPLDVLDVLVTEGSLSDPEIRDQVVTLIGAGYDTTAAALAWMLWCATLTPGLWDSLAREAEEVLGPVDEPRALDRGALASLGLADRVMRETLRLHPPGALTPREAVSDLVVGGYRIPKGTLILWSAHLAGRNGEAWEDPLRFDPSRFDDPTPEQRAIAESAWVPFGRGHRGCIGFAMAQMELTLIIARLAQRLVLRPTADTVPEPVGVVINRPRGGVPMTVSARV